MISVAATYIHTTRHIYEESQFADRRQSFEIGLKSTTADIYVSLRRRPPVAFSGDWGDFALCGGRVVSAHEG